MPITCDYLSVVYIKIFTTIWTEYRFNKYPSFFLIQPGRLHMCYVNDIRNFDIDVKDLRRVDDFQLAEGSYGCVQKMEWRQNKSSDAMMVAVKYNKSPLSPNTAAEILLEEDNLRYVALCTMNGAFTNA